MSKPAFRFLEVGIMVGHFEFYHVFAVPLSLCMKRYKGASSQKVDVSVEDWLQLDFPTILAMRLGVLSIGRMASSPGPITCHYVATYRHDKDNIVPISYAFAQASSWVDPFINDIASYFANNVSLFSTK